MASVATGDCFIAFAPNSQEKTVIFGRNSTAANGEVQEVVYYAPSEQSGQVKCDGGADIDFGPTFGFILQKSKSVWGGEYGANEKNVCIGVTWSDREPFYDALASTDLVRLALERSATAAEAVDQIGSLVNYTGSDKCKFNFAICDPNEAWLLSVGGKIWAGQKLKLESGFQRLPSGGLAVGTTIDKSTDELGESLKALGRWSGDGDLDFAKSFSSPATVEEWPGEEPVGDGLYNLTCMFETLRSAASDSNRSSSVSVLSSSGISCHWFTATPNPRESVFKPFVFAPNPKISPLTKIPDGESVTLLHKLHEQRKPEAVRDLKNLEASCVDEVNTYLEKNSTPTAELDELMKDCVEAEVKFYR